MAKKAWYDLDISFRMLMWIFAVLWLIPMIFFGHKSWSYKDQLTMTSVIIPTVKADTLRLINGEFQYLIPVDARSISLECMEPGDYVIVAYNGKKSEIVKRFRYTKSLWEFKVWELKQKHLNSG